MATRSSEQDRDEQPGRGHAGLTRSPTDTKTTGVLVFSGGTRVRTVIAHHHIFDNKIGIWLSKPVKAFGLGTNSFHHVKTPISAGH